MRINPYKLELRLTVTDLHEGALIQAAWWLWDAADRVEKEIDWPAIIRRAAVLTTFGVTPGLNFRLPGRTNKHRKSNGFPGR